MQKAPLCGAFFYLHGFYYAMSPKDRTEIKLARLRTVLLGQPKQLLDRIEPVACASLWRCIDSVVKLRQG